MTRRCEEMNVSCARPGQWKKAENGGHTIHVKDLRVHPYSVIMRSELMAEIGRPLVSTCTNITASYTLTTTCSSSHPQHFPTRSSLWAATRASCCCRFLRITESGSLSSLFTASTVRPNGGDTLAAVSCPVLSIQQREKEDNHPFLKRIPISSFSPHTQTLIRPSVVTRVLSTPGVQLPYV